MKKIFSLLLIVAALLTVSSVNAQRFAPLNTVAGDTIITSGSKDTVNKVVPVTAGYSSGAIKVTYTKISGTVALKAYIYPGDGTDFENSPTDSSAAFSNASGYVYFTKSNLPYSHYRVQVRAADGANSTQSVKIVVSHLLKRFD
jgi:hypothetical protein